jgi:hypothetical protein
MAVDQLMTYAGVSEVYDIGTDTQIDYMLAPSQEAYVEYQTSTDAGATWATTSTRLLTAPIAFSLVGQAPNTQYRVRLYGGVGTLLVQLDSTP